MKHHPAEDLDEPSKIFKLLQDTFEDRRTLCSLMREFCIIVQKDDGSVTDYAFALMHLMDKLKCVPGAPGINGTLKEQFRDGMADMVLQREVKLCMKEN